MSEKVKPKVTKAQAWKEYREALAQARKRYDKIAAQAWEKCKKALAEASS